MRRIFLFLFLIFGFLFRLSAQGIYKEFGQNRVQYRTFVWEKLTFNNIDIIYYDKEDVLANNALNIAMRELERLESYLSYKYGGAMQLVVFSNLNDYRQSNIGYTNPQLNSGGFLMIPNDISSIYFDGDYHHLQMQIRKAICDIMLREMIFGGTLQDRFERVRSPMLPTWFTEGIGAFLAESWNADNENRMHDAFATGKFNNFNNLTPEETLLAGHSIWRYLVEVYGVEAVSTIVFIARYTHSADAAIYFHTRKNMGEFLHEWREFYAKSLLSGSNQNLPKGKSNIPGKIARKIHTDLAISPDGQKVAIVTNDRGHFDIWTYNLSNEKVKHIYQGGQRVLNQLPDYGFPKVAWNSAGMELYFITCERGKYFLKAHAQNHTRNIFEFREFTGIRSFSLDSAGETIAFSGVKNGKCDIYLLHIKTKLISRLTSDLFHDDNPVFRSNGTIAFISNRSVRKDSGDLGFVSGTQNLFEYNNGKILALTGFSSTNNLGSIIIYSAESTGFLSDNSGISNAYVTSQDSGNRVFGQTNYKLGILNQSISGDGKTLAELLLVDGRYHIFTSVIPEDPLKEIVNPGRLPWKNSIENLDSLFKERNVQVSNNLLPGSDSVSYSRVDSTDHSYHFQTGFDKVDYQMKALEDSSLIAISFKRSNFHNSLQPDYLLSQSENRLLGSYLQSNRIRRDALRNQLIMPYLKVSVADILKNYILEAGVRTSLDLMLTDYTARFALLKYRFDHDINISRHMRKYEDAGRTLRQNISVQGTYTLSYPLSEKSRFSLQAGGRYEYQTVKGSESRNLNIPDLLDYYATGNFSYTYDNTTSLGLNAVKGVRGNLGLDVLQKINSELMVRNLYADFRGYVPLYRKIILAGRFTASYALGNGKVAYYLGAVENWTAKNQFLPSTQSLKESEYVFQQWVGNLRGFYRGVRLGSSFGLINAELRVPLIQTMINRPVESEFLRYFTVTGFLDCGTAFIGKSPADPSNPFNTIYQGTPNYDISITSSRNPMVVGLGYGFRTRFLGYFIKFDRAWGYMENTWFQPMNYFSLGFDF